MPCNSDHMIATEIEKECCKLVQLIEELKTGVHVNPKTFGGEITK